MNSDFWRFRWNNFANSLHAVCRKLLLEYFLRTVENFVKFAKLRTCENFALYGMDEIYVQSWKLEELQQNNAHCNMLTEADKFGNYKWYQCPNCWNIRMCEYPCSKDCLNGLETRLIFESRVSETLFVAVMPLSPLLYFSCEFIFCFFYLRITFLILFV